MVAKRKWFKSRPGKTSLFIGIGTLLAIYLCIAVIAPGLITKVLSISSLSIIALTVLARVNDIERTKIGKRWEARRIGLTMMGTGAVSLAAAQVFGIDTAPQWRNTIFQLGIALTWLTTPYMPPWWKWISRKDPKDIKVDNEGQL